MLLKAIQIIAGLVIAVLMVGVTSFVINYRGSGTGPSRLVDGWCDQSGDWHFAHVATARYLDLQSVAPTYGATTRFLLRESMSSHGTWFGHGYHSWIELRWDECGTIHADGSVAQVDLWDEFNDGLAHDLAIFVD